MIRSRLTLSSLTAALLALVAAPAFVQDEPDAEHPEAHETLMLIDLATDSNNNGTIEDEVIFIAEEKEGGGFTYHHNWIVTEPPEGPQQKDAADDAVEMDPPGKVVLLNDDDSDLDGQPDNANQEADGPDDEAQMIEVRVRLLKEPEFPPGEEGDQHRQACRVTLWIGGAHKERIRVFDRGFQTVCIGPTPGEPSEFSQWSEQDTLISRLRAAGPDASEVFYVEGCAVGGAILRVRYEYPGGDLTDHDEVRLNVVDLDLDVDTNRIAGIQDFADEEGEETWTNERGAILLVNCDDDDGDHIPDCHFPQNGNQIGATADELINGPNDPDDLAPLVIRRTGDLGGLQLRLEIPTPEEEHIRIFRRRSYVAPPNAPENQAVLSSTHGIVAGNVRYWLLDADTVQALETGAVTLGAEATHFADWLDHGDFDGLVSGIKLVLDSDTDPTNDNDIVEDVVHLKVAPFELLSNQDGVGRTHVTRLHEFAPGYPDNGAFITGLDNTGGNVFEIPGEPYGYDPWPQDEMEIGYTRAPYQQMHVVLDLPRNGGLDPYPENGDPDGDGPAPRLGLLGPGFGYYEPWPRGQEWEENYGGNIEVTPSLPDVPEGRQVLSEMMATGLTRFFDRQEVQRPEIPVETGWLAVQHVDEIVNVLSGGASPVVLVADSNLGWQSLVTLRDDGQGNQPIASHAGFNAWVNNHTNPAPPPDCAAVYVVWDAGLGHWRVHTIAEVLAYPQLADLNTNSVRTILDNVAQSVGTALPGAQIIRVPVVFADVNAAPGAQDCFALTPDLVNGPLIGANLVVPDPYLPDYPAGQDYFLWLLENDLPGGFVIREIDDYLHYHLGYGEVHCGSNVERNIPARNWWEGL